LNVTSLGEIAYQAYAQEVGGLTFDGKPLPEFNQLGEPQKEAWNQAGWAAVKHIGQTLEE